VKAWWLLVAGVVGLVIALIFRRNPVTQMGRELAGIREASQAKKATAEKGTGVAATLVEANHAEAIAKFDENQKKKADKLRGNPPALARWLNRISD